MKRDFFVILGFLVFAMMVGFVPLSTVCAQDSPLPLGAGVLTTVQPSFQDSGIQYNETFHRQDLVEVLANAKGAPLERLESSVVFNRDDWAKNVRFNRDIWCLQFQYKPFRTIMVDLPDENGHLKPTQIWYLVYAVTNTGKTLRTVPSKSTEKTELTFPVQSEITIEPCNCAFCQEERTKKGLQVASKTIAAEPPLVLRNLQGAYGPENAKETKGKYTWEWAETPIQFIPRFILSSDRLVEDVKSAVDPQTGDISVDVQRGKVSYPEQILPLAVAEISKQEKAAKMFETTVSIASKEIEPHQTVWGVATWRDVDPRINFFSVHVAGLTNAYYWENVKQGDDYAFKKGDPIGSGRVIKRKTLTLNFRRLGDQYEVRDRQFRIGIPGELDYEWAYR